MDAQGVICDVGSSLLPSRRRNNEMVRTLAVVPFAGKTTISDIIWPNGGQLSPEVIYQGIRTIQTISFYFRTGDGRPMLFLYGGVHIVIALTF
jgi:hypothetical protein